jgi:predicted ATP-dependent serine protease
MNNNDRKGFGSDFGGFDIRNYVDQLTKAKEPGKYICPACGGHNLSINLKTGKFNCFNCGDTKAIASALTKPERDHKQFMADIERRNKENVKRAKREELRQEAEDLPDDLVDRYLEIEEGIQRGVEASSPGERVTLAIQGLLLEKDPVTRELMRSALIKRFGLHPETFDRLVLEVAGGSQSGKLKVFTGGEFLNADIQPVTFLVQGVPFGGVTLLAGSAGSGKTTLAYWLGKCVLDNVEFLGDTPSQTGGVIIVNSDEGKSSSQERFFDMDYPEDDRWTYLASFNVDRHFTDLEELVQQKRPKLVIVDSFCGIQSESFDENSALTGLTIQKFNALAELYNCAVVMIHHLNKSDEVRGHSRIKDCVHAILQIKANADNTREYCSKKVRCASTFSYTLGLTDEGLPKILRGGESQHTIGIKDEILAILQTSEKSLEVQEICQLTQYSTRQVLDALRKLKDSGKVKHRKSKRDQRAKVWSCSFSSEIKEGGVFLEAHKIAETTTVQSLEGKKNYEPQYEPLQGEAHKFEGEAHKFEGEAHKRLINFSGINPSPDEEYSEIMSLPEGRGGSEKASDNLYQPKNQSSSNKNSSPKLPLWVMFKGKKWSVKDSVSGFYSLSEYGKLKPEVTIARLNECTDINWGER